jgi:hypothetical protein
MMKLFGALIIILISYIIFFDLKHGTLPAAIEKAEIVRNPTTVSLSFFEERVRAGDTVLTIIENRLKSQIPVSINEIVDDFVVLNAGTTPEKIQIGKTYRFPDYSN